MRFFLLAILFALYVFPSGAAEKSDPCILKNTMFCGQWEGTERFDQLTITGKTLVWPDGMYAVCTVLKEDDFQEDRFEGPTTILECMRTLYFNGKRSQEKAYYLLKAYKDTNEYSTFKSIRLFHANHLPEPYSAFEDINSRIYWKKECPVLNNLDSRCWQADSSPYYAPL